LKGGRLRLRWAQGRGSGTEKEEGGTWAMVARLATGPAALGRPEMNSCICDSFKKNSNGLELIQSKDGIPVIEQFQIKHRFVGN
jgi:hypothetical protein